MDLVSLLIYLVIFGLVLYAAWYIIEKFFPEPMKMVAKVIVGLLALIILLGYFLGNGGGIHLAPLNR